MMTQKEYLNLEISDWRLVTKLKYRVENKETDYIW